MLTLDQLQTLKDRNFSFVDSSSIDRVIVELEKKQLALGTPGAELAAQRAKIISDENNAPALAIEQKILEEANSVLMAEIKSQETAKTEDLYQEETEE